MPSSCLNFTPVPREGYRVGVPRLGRYREMLNSDSQYLRRLELRQRRSPKRSPRRAWGSLSRSSWYCLPLGGVVLVPG